MSIAERQNLSKPILRANNDKLFARGKMEKIYIKRYPLIIMDSSATSQRNLIGIEKKSNIV